MGNGAEWNSLEVSPSFYARTGSHFDFLEFGPLYSPARYGANPILAYLFEKDDTRALVFGAWQRDRRDAAGMGLEDYVPAFVRIGQEDGVYPKGYASFANDMGWYGARLVTMDFVKQAVLNDILFSLRSKNLVPHFYTRWSPLARLAIPPCSHHRHRATCWSSGPISCR